MSDTATPFEKHKQFIPPPAPNKYVRIIYELVLAF